MRILGASDMSPRAMLSLKMKTSDRWDPWPITLTWPTSTFRNAACSLLTRGSSAGSIQLNMGPNRLPSVADPDLRKR
jgi:hypothetical protein